MVVSACTYAIAVWSQYPGEAPIWAVETHLALTPQSNRPALLIDLMRDGFRPDVLELDRILKSQLRSGAAFHGKAPESEVDLHKILHAPNDIRYQLLEVAIHAESIRGNVGAFRILITDFLADEEDALRGYHLDTILDVVAWGELDAEEKSLLTIRLLEYPDFGSRERERILGRLEWFVDDRRTAWTKKGVLDIEDVLIRNFPHTDTEGKLSIFGVLMDLPKPPSKGTQAFLMRIASDKGAPLWQRIYAVLPFLQHGPIHTGTETGETCLDVLRATVSQPAYSARRGPLGLGSPLEQAMQHADNLAREALMQSVGPTGPCPPGVEHFTLEEWLGLVEKQGAWLPEAPKGKGAPHAAHGGESKADEAASPAPPNP